MPLSPNTSCPSPAPCSASSPSASSRLESLLTLPLDQSLAELRQLREELVEERRKLAGDTPMRQDQPIAEQGSSLNGPMRSELVMQDAAMESAVPLTADRHSPLAADQSAASTRASTQPMARPAVGQPQDSLAVRPVTCSPLTQTMGGATSQPMGGATSQPMGGATSQPMGGQEPRVSQWRSHGVSQWEEPRVSQWEEPRVSQWEEPRVSQ